MALGVIRLHSGKRGAMLQLASIFFAATALMLGVSPVIAGEAEGREARVHLAAVRKPVIAAEQAGRITALDFRAGQSFASGALLLALDCALHEAREARAAAQRDRAQRLLLSLRQLDRSGATSRLEIGVALADMAAADADLRAAQITLQRCQIRAPFAGRVVEQRVQLGEYVAEGQAVLEIIDDTDLEFESIVPSHMLTWLREGTFFEAELHELASPVRGHITRIAPVIDPVSQTVKIYGRAETDDRRLMAGMSGIARFERPRDLQERR